MLAFCAGGSSIKKGRFVKLALIVLSISFVTMCRVSIVNHQEAMKVADVFALESAFAIKEHIKSNSTCPEKLPKWDDVKLDHSNREYVQRGNEHGKYRVLYKCNDDLSFSVAVFYSFDSEKFFSSTETGEIKITYGHFTQPKHIYVNQRKEIIGAITKTYE